MGRRKDVPAEFRRAWVRIRAAAPKSGKSGPVRFNIGTRHGVVHFGFDRMVVSWRGVPSPIPGYRQTLRDFYDAILACEYYADLLAVTKVVES